MKKVGLILEGGGMRGMFTAGVLDFFLEKEIEFEEVIGVSAGACHACSYISKQKYRARDVFIDYLDDKRYLSFNNLRTTGDMFGAKFIYDEIPNKLNLFDNETFMKSKTKFYVTVTDVETGEPEYIHIKNAQKDIDAVRASASLPMISNIVTYNGKKYLDGGIADSIPLKKSEEDGYDKNILILTRDKDYIKKSSKSYLGMKRRYKDYPQMVDKIKNRHTDYNNTINYINKRVKEGKVFIIQPDKKLKVSRIEKNRHKLEETYMEGYKTARRLYKDLINFIEE